jgi:hypothetical protein
LEGTRPDMALTMPTIAGNADAAAIVAAVSAQNFRVQSVSTGDILRSSAANNPIDVDDTIATLEYTYCLNLVSLVGSLCSQNYLPLFAMTSAPLRLEIQLVDTLNKAMNCVGAVVGAGTFIDQVEFVAQMIELSDSAMSIISSSLGGSPLQFVIPSYRNYQFSTPTLANGVSTQVNFPIAAKFSSLKSLFVTQRDQVGANGHFPHSSVTGGLVDYQFRVGSVPVPAKAVATRAEQFAELLKAIGSLSDIHHQPSIEGSAYTLPASIANTLALEGGAGGQGASTRQSGAFYVGLNLENYEASSKDTIFAGWNSNTDDIYYIGNYNPTANIILRLDAFALFDAVLVCENSTAYVRF